MDGGPAPIRVPAFAIFTVFLKLGLTSFGGPVAHLGYFRTEFVERRRWISEADYAELVALAQFLPGPASSQTGYAIGARLAGLPGGLAAFAGFTLPSALLMLAAAFGLGALDEAVLGPLTHGLKLTAVAVVAHAVAMMAMAHCRRPALIVLAAITATGCLWVPHAATAPAAILFAAVAGAILARGAGAGERREPTHSGSAGVAMAALLAFAVLLAALPLLRGLSDAPVIATADIFYRAGALVFGGGHVILPLLQAETAATVSEDAFLAGYGAAQALPGPLFAFSAYLGALGGGGHPDVVLGAVALGAVFLPGLLLMHGAMRMWGHVRTWPRASAGVTVASAAVVGVLGAALIQPVGVSSVTSVLDLAIAALGFAALMTRRYPTLAVVCAVTLAGAFASMV